MARRRRERMSEGKKNIIAGLIQEYNIKTAEDIQEALKDLLGGTIQEMMEAELDEHLGYDEYERSDNPDYRNGVKHKKLRSSYGSILQVLCKYKIVQKNLFKWTELNSVRFYVIRKISNCQ